MMKEYNFCNNCGKHGHLFHQCKNPITSIGIIVFNKDTINDLNERKYLMIRRKDSLGYVDFMRGKYPLYNIEYLQNIVNEMTLTEKLNLLSVNYNELWNNLWGNNLGFQYRGEEKISFDKFNQLKKGIMIKDNTVTLESLILNSDTRWKEPEWGFPKGRRKYKEKDLNCALREFEEETGIHSNCLTNIQNIIPFEEVFTGSNYKSYKHKYYVAFCKNSNSVQMNAYQTSEVSSMQWFSFEDCNQIIRPYNLEKKRMLSKINKTLNNYRFFYS